MFRHNLTLLQARPFSRALPLRRPSGHRVFFHGQHRTRWRFGSYSCVIFHFIRGLKVAWLMEFTVNRSRDDRGCTVFTKFHFLVVSSAAVSISSCQLAHWWYLLSSWIACVRRGVTDLHPHDAITYHHYSCVLSEAVHRELHLWGWPTDLLSERLQNGIGVGFPPRIIFPYIMKAPPME
jgi:hypothetical protein